MSRILLTGSTGFIGRNLLRVLQQGHEVYALARSTPAHGAESRVHWIEQDLAERLDVRRFPERIDAVIHLAQSKHYREFPERADDIFRVNVQSTAELLEYARRAGAQRFLLASSGGVYGNSAERFLETDPVSPLNFYLSSKYASELLVANYKQFFHTIVFRFFFVYGPGQRDMLIPRLLQRVRQGEAVTIDGNPGLRTNPVYIDDAISVFEPSLRLESSDLFNVAGNDVVSLTDLVQMCGAVVNRPPVIQYRETQQQGDLIASNQRMASVLGVTPQTALVDGMREAARSLFALAGAAA